MRSIGAVSRFAARRLGGALLGVLLAGCVAPPASTPGALGRPQAEQAGAPAHAAPPAPSAGQAGALAQSGAAAPAEPRAEATALEPDGVPLGSGLASWYGARFQGRRTASGERFDRDELTAAHPTLPFGARVCVRSLVNGRAVVVRINDRGPFTPGRVIDLSQAAAQELGMMGLGIKPVELWRLGPEDDACPDAQPPGGAAQDDDLAARIQAAGQAGAKASPARQARPRRPGKPRKRR